jgi:uncharacterized membrane protein YccF (DUF307 family)
MINVILNVLWLLFGGIAMAVGWFVASFVMVLTIVGIPFARAAFNMGIFALWPFGRQIADREDLTGQGDIGTGGFGALGNIVWLLFAGIWLAIAHIGIAFASAITIIGIPFAWQHLKFVGLAIWPIGKAIVDRDGELASPFAGLEPRRAGDADESED